MTHFELIYNLFDCYNDGYQPPNMLNTSLMKFCKVFYHDGDKLEDVMKLVKYREPVNIGMERLYSQYKLNKYFNFRTGYYGHCDISKNDITPPNFIVYTPTFVLNFDKPIHILNTIGLAFDNHRQRDYKLYMKLGKEELGNNDKHVFYAKNFYKRLFTLIFEACKILEKKNLIMSFVGANNFALLWKGGPNNFKRQIWFPAFNEIVKNYKKINIMFMGADVEGYNNLGFFPQLLKNPKISNKLDNTLFVNAWDCWSVPGNGNSYDNSLDGYIGRNTQIGILGTSLTNPFLDNKSNYIKIK